ncbi:MAG TPA: serine/threonine-protein kinase [Planctomycetota bacterium]|nr:serine/threonine-protein kinase [Planctomycetota bacterium]
MSSAVNGPSSSHTADAPAGGPAGSRAQPDDPTQNQPLKAVVPQLAGRTLGQYRILEKIGQGGMGSVFKAFDTMLERSVALKVLVSSVLDDAKQSERFLREARSLARLKHPNLVHVYNVGFENDCYYFAMELVEGETLAAAVRRRRRIPAEELIPYLGQVLSALHYVHMQGITHRDIKSGNVMLAGKRAVLMDFGLAKDENFSGLTSVGAIVGTPDYMSPECAEGLTAGPPTDIYSVGVVMYEALSGAVPFTGRSAMSIIRQHLDIPPPPIEAALPGIDPMLASIVHKCLAKKPLDRYANCAALAADLIRLRSTPELQMLAEELLHGSARTLARGATQQSGGCDATLIGGAHSQAAGDADATLTAGGSAPLLADMTVANGPVRSPELSAAGTVVDHENTIVLPPQPSKPSQWPAWVYVCFGFFGVFFLVFFLAVLKGSEQPQKQKPAGQPVLARKVDGGSEEIRWIEFKADDADPARWYHVIERRQPDGSWQRATVSHQDLRSTIEGLDLLHSLTPETQQK